MELTTEERRIVDTFYLDPEFEEKETAEQFLKLNGYDGEQGEIAFKKFIALKKAEFAIKKGTELQRKFDIELDKVKKGKNESDEEGKRYQLAARNLEELTGNDKKVTLDNLKAITKSAK
ncbi:MAG: hypothetical protein WC209_14580 [Ignavibacteriaceae bacterium]|jgi:hypothetical protein